MIPKSPTGRKITDERGNQYGRLTVVKFSHQDRHRYAHWVCLCDCGRKVTINGCSLRRGKTTSCGCFALSESIKRSTKVSKDKKDRIMPLRLQGKTVGEIAREIGCSSTTVWHHLNKISNIQMTAGALERIRELNGGFKHIDETNNRYGRLTVIKRSTKPDKYNRALWLCKCDCGNEAVVAGGSLRAGQRSCGCLKGNYTQVFNAKKAKTIRDSNTI